MKKWFVTLLVMLTTLLSASSAMAVTPRSFTAIAPYSSSIIEPNSRIWKAKSSYADYTEYEVWDSKYTYGDGSITLGILGDRDAYIFIIQYDPTGQPRSWYIVIRDSYVEDDDDLYINYNAAGEIKEVRLSTGYQYNIWDGIGSDGYSSEYLWDFYDNSWHDRYTGEIPENIPPFGPSNYPLTITWVDENGQPVGPSQSTPTATPTLTPIPEPTVTIPPTSEPTVTPPPTPTPTTPPAGTQAFTLQQAADGKFYCYDTSGNVATSYSDPAFVFETGKFLIIDGKLKDDVNGVLYVSGPDFYFYAGGQVQEVSQLALYDGSWFLLKDGKVNQSYTGLYKYDGATFLITEGWLRDDYTGTWTQDGISYEVVGGQVMRRIPSIKR